MFSSSKKSLVQLTSSDLLTSDLCYTVTVRTVCPADNSRAWTDVCVSNTGSSSTVPEGFGCVLICFFLIHHRVSVMSTVVTLCYGHIFRCSVKISSISLKWSEYYTLFTASNLLSLVCVTMKYSKIFKKWQIKGYIFFLTLVFVTLGDFSNIKYGAGLQKCCGWTSWYIPYRLSRMYLDLVPTLGGSHPPFTCSWVFGKHGRSC